MTKQEKNIEDYPSDCPFMVGENDSYPLCSALDNACCVWHSPDILQWVQEDVLTDYEGKFGKLPTFGRGSLMAWVDQWWGTRDYRDFLVTINRQTCPMHNPEIVNLSEKEDEKIINQYFEERLKRLFSFIRDKYTEIPIVKSFIGLNCNCLGETPVIISCREQYGTHFCMDKNVQLIRVYSFAVNPFIKHLAKQNYVIAKKTNETVETYDIELICPVCGQSMIVKNLNREISFILAGKDVTTDKDLLENCLAISFVKGWIDLLDKCKLGASAQPKQKRT